MSLSRIASLALNTPLMIHPQKAAAIAVGLGARMTGGRLQVSEVDAVRHTAFQNGRPSMGVLDDRLGRSYDACKMKPYAMDGNLAVIPIEGTLVHKGAWVESDSGETSYQGLQAQVKRALVDPAVRGVVFEVDSFGGQVAGAFETAEMIFELSQAKPTIAICTDYAYSAGYLMASAARQIVLPETGGIGSIGVVTMHVDMSGAIERQGYKVTIIAAGEHKADGNAYEPLPPEVFNDIMGEVQAARTIFANTVGKFRGERLSAAEALATEANCFAGAEGVKAGLADATGSPLAAYQAFVSTINGA